MQELATGLQRIDFYIPEHNLCVEVDGSIHYYGLSQHMLAKSVLKYRMMEHVGLRVVRLEHFKCMVKDHRIDRDIIK